MCASVRSWDLFLRHLFKQPSKITVIFGVTHLSKWYIYIRLVWEMCMCEHTIVTLEDLIHTGKKPPMIPSAALTWLVTHSEAAFSVSISVFAASDKRRNVGVACIYVFCFMFALCGCVTVLLVHNKGSRMSEYLYLLLQYFGFILRNPKGLLLLNCVIVVGSVIWSSQEGWCTCHFYTPSLSQSSCSYYCCIMANIACLGTHIWHDVVSVFLSSYVIICKFYETVITHALLSSGIFWDGTRSRPDTLQDSLRHYDDPNVLLAPKSILTCLNRMFVLVSQAEVRAKKNKCEEWKSLCLSLWKAEAQSEVFRLDGSNHANLLVNASHVESLLHRAPVLDTKMYISLYVYKLFLLFFFLKPFGLCYPLS